jgi:hypothetical protein
MAERNIKYMGSSHERRVSKGETFDGRLPGGLDRDLVWNKANKWVVDVDGMDSDALELLLEDTADFKDVTDLKRVPSNDHQKMFLGHKASETVSESSGDDDANPAGGGDGGGTSVGGSTAGDAGAATGGGGRRGGRGGGTTVGGSGSD